MRKGIPLVRRLTSGAYQPYGSVIAAGQGPRPVAANMGTARRYNFLADLVDLRPGRAKPNLCVFRCSPWTRSVFAAKLLERHLFSTQVFIPMSGAGPFLVIVCLGGDKPNLSTAAAFRAQGAGISYKPGVWHHPLIALDKPSDFACLVWEDGGAGDCEVSPLDSPVCFSLR